jgi:hypothetical protein
MQRCGRDLCATTCHDHQAGGGPPPTYAYTPPPPEMWCAVIDCQRRACFLITSNNQSCGGCCHSVTAKNHEPLMAKERHHDQWGPGPAELPVLVLARVCSRDGKRRSACGLQSRLCDCSFRNRCKCQLGPRTTTVPDQLAPYFAEPSTRTTDDARLVGRWTPRDWIAVTHWAQPIGNLA